MGAPGDTPRPARLPRGAPDGLRQFVACSIDRVELDLGDLGWVPKPAAVPDALTPSVSVLDGWTPGSATIRIGYGPFISIELPATIVDGQLQVDSSNLGFGLKPEIDRWVAAFNATLRAHDKQLDTFDVRDGKVALTKRAAVAAAAPGGATVAPPTSATPTEPPAEDERKKRPTGCFAWLAGAIAAIAAAVGIGVAVTNDGDDGDDAVSTGTPPAAVTDPKTSTSNPATSTTSTTLAEVGQVPEPPPDTPAAVCGQPLDPEAQNFWRDPGALTVDPGAVADALLVWSDALDEGRPCTPPTGGYGSCDPVFLPCSDGTDVVLTLTGGVGTDHSGSVPDAVTGEEGESTAEHALAMYAATGDVRWLIRLTSSCSGDLLTGEAPVVPNDVTIVAHPLRQFGLCTVVGAEVVPQAGDTSEQGLVDAANRALDVQYVGNEFFIDASEPDPLISLPEGGFALEDVGLDNDDLLGPAVTLGNTFGVDPVGNDCLWFFAADNAELVAKVLDACTGGSNDHFWVFYAATSNVEFEVTVSDTPIGTAGHVANPLGDPFAAVGDTEAFRTSDPYFGNTIYPCGWGHVAYTACPADADPMDAGAFVTVTGAMAGSIPIEGDGSDRTHTIDFGPSGGPAYDVTQDTDGWTVSSSAGVTGARALIRDNALMLVAPRDELPEGALAYIWRTTVDGQTHDQPVVPVSGVITTPPFPAEGAAPPATDAPASTDAPAATDAPAPADTPPTEGAEPTETLDAFYEQLTASISSGDIAFALDRLDPLVLEAYPDQCQAALESFADPDLVIDFVSEGERGPWTWELPDGRTFEVPDTVEATVTLSGRGQTGTESVAHLTVIDGRYHWFTNC